MHKSIQISGHFCGHSGNSSLKSPMLGRATDANGLQATDAMTTEVIDKSVIWGQITFVNISYMKKYDHYIFMLFSVHLYI